MSLITKVVSHPTLPLTITAHEDRHIRFFDNNTGKLTHAMVAHLDAVTSLAVDPNGLYLISGSEFHHLPRALSLPLIPFSVGRSCILTFCEFRSRLQHSPLEPRDQDLRAGDNGAPQKV